jgi:V8-like Glu-specific endopeptidase
MRYLILLSLLSSLSSDIFALWNGEEATEGDFPATIYFDSCTGARIGAKHILTAAHCLDNSYKKGAVLKIYSGAKILEASMFEHQIEEVFIHPSYKEKQEKGFDLALLVLRQDLDKSIAVAVISPEKLNLEEKIILAGHGMRGPGLLEQKIFNGDIVVSSQLKIEDNLHFAESRVDKIEVNRFMAYAQDYQASLGRGDSGGAVFLASDTTHLTIVGVNSEANILSKTSYFSRIDNETNPNIYAWIQDIIGLETISSSTN